MAANSVPTFSKLQREGSPKVESSLSVSKDGDDGILTQSLSLEVVVICPKQSY